MVKRWPAGKNTRQRVMTYHWLAVISIDGKAHSPCVLSIIICNIKRLYCYQSFSNFLIFFLFLVSFFVLKSCMECGYINKRSAVIEKSENCDDKGSNSLPPSHSPSTSPTHLWNTSTDYSLKTFHLESNNMWWSRLYALESSICRFQYGLRHLNSSVLLGKPLKLCMPQFPCLTSEDDK